MKEPNFQSKTKLRTGVDKVVNTCKITIGPKGRNVAISRRGNPIIANDAGTIAQSIQIKDDTENIGADIAKGVIKKISEEVGGGRTAGAILFQSIIEEGTKAIDKGMNLNLLHKGMKRAVEDIHKGLDKISKPVKSKDEIRQVAIISTEDEDLGTEIADVVYKLGEDCDVTVEDSQVLGVSSSIVKGIKFDKGWISPFMVTNPRMEAEYKNVHILLTDKKISMWAELGLVVNKLKSEGHNSLVVICEDFDAEALNYAILNKLKGGFNLLAIKIPGFTDKKEWLEDIAISVGAQISTSAPDVKLNEVKLGLSRKVLSKKDSTRIEGSQNVESKIEELKALKETSENKYEQDKLKKRIAILSGSVGVIKVGAPTDEELTGLKLKIEDGINEAKRALEGGIVPGGDVAFINALKTLPRVKLDTQEETKGYEIVTKAVHAPFKQIITNAHDSAEVILNIIENNKSHIIGYNANTNRVVEDMFKEGIIDATKVPKTALEKAVSGAFKFLTIECTVCDIEENDKQNPQVVEY